MDKSGVAIWVLLLSSAVASVRADVTADPLSVYKSGDYVHAIPLVRQAIAQAPKNAPLQAALLSSLVYQGIWDESANLADTDAEDFPQSPEVLTARGDFEYLMGDLAQAESLYKAALKINDKYGRAYYGLYKVNRAASMYRNARLLCFAAHQNDPDDALITYTFMNYLVPEKRNEMLPAFKESHPWFFKRRSDADEKAESELEREVEGRKLFVPDEPPKEATIPMHYLHNGQQIRGMGVDISINGSKPLRVMLDTGSTGLLLKQSAIDSAGLRHMGSFQINGIGDQGAKNGFAAIADTCSIDAIKFKSCLIEGTEGGERIAGEEDGLLGLDLFEGYLATIDFQQYKLHLVPLPERKASLQGYNREPLPSEAGYTPVFRFGHNLYIPTRVNGKITGLFLIDTGSEISSIDTGFAQLTTKIHGSPILMRGVSGKVKTVSSADKAKLEFAHFSQDNVGLPALNLNGGEGHRAVRIDGILGFQILMFFRLTIDYQNGLVNFDYVPDHFFGKPN